MKILVVHTSLGGAQSATRQMAGTYVDAVAQANPGANIVERDLAADPIPHLPAELVPVQFGLPAEETPAVVRSDLLIEELEAADLLVIGAPMYNFTIPSTLKAWLDHVIRAQRTFSYASGAPQGLLAPGKKVVVMLASGGVYSQGSAQSMDFVAPYLRAVLGFIGLTDVTIIRAEAQAVPDAGLVARSAALVTVRELALRQIATPS